MTEFIQIPHLENILVMDVMTKSVVSVDSSATAHDAVKMMEESEIGTILVFENNMPVGIIHVTDLINHFIMCVKDEPS